MKYVQFQISILRLYYSWHSLAKVEGASEVFMTRLSQNMADRITIRTTFDRKLLRKTRRAMQGIYMKAGTRCGRNFVLSMMESFSDKYFTAALWK